MDSIEAIALAIGGAVIALVTAMVIFRPFGGIKRSGDDHKGGALAWIGANHRKDGDCGHDSGSSGDGGGD